MTPPSTWPTTAPQAITAEYRESARARAAPENVRWIRLITCGIISAAADALEQPERRPALPVFGASPQASDAAVKPIRPRRNTRPCPKPVTQTGAGDQQNGVADGVAGDRPSAARHRTRAGRRGASAPPTLTIETSRIAMNWPRAGRRGSRRAVGRLTRGVAVSDAVKVERCHVIHGAPRATSGGESPLILVPAAPVMDVVSTGRLYW